MTDIKLPPGAVLNPKPKAGPKLPPGAVLQAPSAAPAAPTGPQPGFFERMGQEPPAGYKVRTQTTERGAGAADDMPLGERLGQLLRTAATDIPVMLGSLPRNVSENVAELKMQPGYGKVQSGKYKGKAANMMDLGIYHEDMPEENLPDWIKALPDEETAKRRFFYRTGMDPVETRGANPSGRITQAAMTGVMSGALGGPEAAMMGGGGALAGQSATEAGAPPEVAIALNLLAGGASPRALRSIAGVGGDLTRTPIQTIARQAEGMSDADLLRTQTLMRQGQELHPDVRLTLGEAGGQVTGGNAQGLTNLQRYVEPNAPRLRQSNVNRTNAFPEVVARQNEAIAGGPLPAGQARAELPGEIQQIGERAMGDVYEARSAQTRPLYDEALDMPPAELHASNIRGWRRTMGRTDIAEAWRRVTRHLRGDEQHRWVTITPDGRVGVRRIPTADDVDAIVKELQTSIDMKEGALPPGKRLSATDPLIQQRDALLAMAERSLPGYREARALHRQLSPAVNAIETGPLGKIAKADPQMLGDSEKAFDQSMSALLPENPGVVDVPTGRATAQRMEAAANAPTGEGRSPIRNPRATRQGVAVYLQKRWNELSRGMKTTGNPQKAGAGYRAAMMGNRSQADITRSVVEELAGPEVAGGMQNMFDVMEATGYSQAPGSQTAYNQAFERQLSGPRGLGGPEDILETAVTSGANIPFKGLGALRERFMTLRHARNAQAIGDLLTDPETIDMLRRLNAMRPQSPNAQRLARQLWGRFMGQEAADPTKRKRTMP